MASVHDGHRARVRERARNEGLASFAPHEVLELLLIQVVPRGDVNPTAHGLIERFGSVTRVLTADEAELCTVPGIGQKSARFLRVWGALAIAYADTPIEQRSRVETSAQAAQALRTLSTGASGQFALVCMDEAGNVSHIAWLSPEEGGMHALMREMVRVALTQHAAQVISAGFSEYLPEQKAFSAHAYTLLTGIEVAYRDHIVCRDDSFISARREGWLTGEEEGLAP